jgi:hypothetical protein
MISTLKMKYKIDQKNTPVFYMTVRKLVLNVIRAMP